MITEKTLQLVRN